MVSALQRCHQGGGGLSQHMGASNDHKLGEFLSAIALPGSQELGKHVEEERQLWSIFEASSANFNLGDEKNTGAS